MSAQLLNNRYRILQTLAAGGFGNTFLAEDTYLPSGRRCVIKQLKPVLAIAGGTPVPQQMYQEIQQRFGREAATLEQLGEGSDQIPKLYAYFSEGGQFYLVQEWIQGQTLTNKVQVQGPLPENTVKEILVSLLRVLDYVHSKRMIHRDVKPDNIIVRTPPQSPPYQGGVQPVLIDFGAVKESMSTVANYPGRMPASMVVGTPGFMPPEQAAGQPVYSSDLYSLGLTAIYMLTGKLPQELQTDPRTGQIIWYQYAASISPSLVAVLDKVIQPHPRDRYTTAREMLDALQSAAAPIPTIPATQPTVPVSPGAHHHPAGSAPHNVPVVNPPNPGGSGPVRIISQWDPQKVLIIGSLIAGGILCALVAFGLLSKRSPQPSPVASSSPPGSEAPVRQSTPSPSTYASPYASPYPSSYQSPYPSPYRSPAKRRKVTPPPVVAESPSPEPAASPEPAPTLSPEPAPARSRQPEPSQSPQPAPASSPSPEPARSDEPLFRRPPSPEPASSPSPEPASSPSPEPERAASRVPSGSPSPEPSPKKNNQQSNPTSNSVPAFPVGTSRSTVEATLGARTRDSRGSYGATRAVIYNFLPNQVDLGYLYDSRSGRVRQTEASFAESVDSQVMLSTLDGLLEGGASDYVKQGLQKVQQGRSSSYTFTQGSLRGQIVKQDCGFIYISIWEANLHDFDVTRARRC